MKARNHTLPSDSDELGCDPCNQDHRNEPSQVSSFLHSLKNEVRTCPWQLGSDTYEVLSAPAYDIVTACALTRAEHDIVQRILLGQANEFIAHARGSCPATVINQVRTIFDKLGVDSRTQLAQKIVPVFLAPSHNDRH